MNRNQLKTGQKVQHANFGEVTVLSVLRVGVSVKQTYGREGNRTTRELVVAAKDLSPVVAGVAK